MTRFWHRIGLFPFLLAGLGLFALGLLALNHIVNNFWPIDVARLDLVRASALGTADAPLLLDAANPEIVAAFLASLMVAVTGIVFPLIYLLNRRLVAGDQAPQALVVLRQSMWVGLWFAFCAWLQMNRTLGIAIAALVAAVLLMFELLLQVRHRAEQGSPA
jgi:uncharacterized membrane protein (UPF0136 family)